MMLVRDHHGAQTNPDVARNATAFVDQIDKPPLRLQECAGLLGEPAFAPSHRGDALLPDEGIPPETLDEAALAFGTPMGPVELADVVGLGCLRRLSVRWWRRRSAEERT